MVWEQNSKAILMLNKLIEKKQVKCHKYWPEGIGSQYTMNLEDVALRVEYIQCEEFDNFCIRTFLLSDMSSGTPNTKEVFQFHYTTWPDFGTPNSPKEFLQFLKKVRDMGVMSSADVGPPIVHCSAGIGRSGTFCLVDCCLVLVDKFGEDNISAREVLRELRSYRMGLIQTTDQLRFSYKAIIEGIKLFNDTVRILLRRKIYILDLNPLVGVNYISHTYLVLIRESTHINYSNLNYRNGVNHQ